LARELAMFLNGGIAMPWLRSLIPQFPTQPEDSLYLRGEGGIELSVGWWGDAIPDNWDKTERQFFEEEFPHCFDEDMAEVEYVEADKVPTAIVIVQGGCVQGVEVPPGMRVLVRDYDVETGTDGAVEDVDGDEYLEAAYGEGEL